MKVTTKMFYTMSATLLSASAAVATPSISSAASANVNVGTGTGQTLRGGFRQNTDGSGYYFRTYGTPLTNGYVNFGPGGASLASINDLTSSFRLS